MKQKSNLIRLVDVVTKVCFQFLRVDHRFLLTLLYIGKILPVCVCPPLPIQCSCLNKERPVLNKKSYAESIDVFAGTFKLI